MIIGEMNKNAYFKSENADRIYKNSCILNTR